MEWRDLVCFLIEMDVVGWCLLKIITIVSSKLSCIKMTLNQRSFLGLQPS